MKEAIQQIIQNFRKFNSAHIAQQAFGLNEDTAYDALVIAPTFSPYHLHIENRCLVTTMKEGAYRAGYLVQKKQLKIAWIKIGSSAGNLIDSLCMCAELPFRKMIFAGAVGALKEDFQLGDVCTPSYSISGSHADAYLKKVSIRESMLFSKVVPSVADIDRVVRVGREKGYCIRKASVFCTPSIALEYTHLDEIRAFDTDLIEIETSSFYLMADLFELPAAALLVVSDNSANGVPYVGRSKEQQLAYEYGRNVVLPDMILALAEA